MAQVSKRYNQATQVGDLQQRYSLQDAVQLLYRTPKAKFDETVDISLFLGVDPRQSTQMVRGTVNLPHGSGKKVTVLVFTEDAQTALNAGADFAGLDDMIEKVLGGWTGFDVAIATTEAMKKVRSVARVLGPRGLMPNPKSGTVTDDIAAGVEAVKAGRVEFKMDKTANLHVVVGKRSFDEAKIVENIQAAVNAVTSARPDEFKGRYVKTLTLSSSMSPGVKVDLKEFSNI